MSLLPADLALLTAPPPASIPEPVKRPCKGRNRNPNPRRGEKHQRARMTDKQVRKMREDYARFQVEDAHLPRHLRRSCYTEMAKGYPCAWQTVRDIVQGRTRIDAGGPISSTGDGA